MKISTVILVSNVKTIFNTLKSCLFSEEVILVIDKNEKSLEKNKLQDFFIKNNFQNYKFFYKKLNNFSKQRNFAINKAKNGWILFIDDDEIISDELKKEIINLSETQKYQSFYIKRKDFFWNKEIKYGELREVFKKGLIRLIKKNTGKWVRQVHEEYITSGRVGYLKNFIYHYPHENIKEFLNKINLYSTLRAEELYKLNKKSNILLIFFYPFGKFIYTYFIKLGFLDGVEGFVYSFMLSFYSFLVRSKLYLLNLKNKKQ